MLAKAQKLGYAEADPTSDVSGDDALNKIAILAKLAFGVDIDIDDVYCEGIETIGIKDIEYAWELGYTIKLLAIAKQHDDGRVEVRVHPTLVQAESIMAYVEDAFNAIEHAVQFPVDGHELARCAGIIEPLRDRSVTDAPELSAQPLEGSQASAARAALSSPPKA